MEREYYDPVTDQLRKYRQRSVVKLPMLSGESWLLMQRMVRGLTNPELELASEVHRQMMGLIANEADVRKAEKFHKESSHSKNILLSPTQSTTTTKITEVKKVTVTKSNKKMEQVKAQLRAIYGESVDVDALLAQLQKGS